MTRVVLLEFVEEFDALKAWAVENGLKPSDFRIIAIEFKLQAHLKKCGAAFDDTLEYFNSASHSRMLLGGEGLLKHVQESVDYRDPAGIKDAYGLELTHYLEIYFNYVAKIIEILDGVCARFADAVIYVPARRNVAGQILVYNDFILGDIAGAFAKARGVEVRRFGPQSAPSGNGLKKTGAPSGAAYGLILGFVSRYFRLFRKAPALLFSKSHGLGKIIDEIGRNSPSVVYVLLRDFEGRKWYHRWAGILSGFFTGFFYVDIDALGGGADPAAEAALTKELDRALAPSPVFVYNGVDIADILRAKTEAAFKGHLLRMNRWGRGVDALMRGFGIRLMISSHGTGVWHVAAELSRKAGVPSLFISHGTHPAPIDRLHELSIFNMCRGFMLGNFTHIAVSTPVQEAHLGYFKKKYAWLKNEEIKTAPLVFASIKPGDREKARAALGIGADEFVMVHAVSLKWRGTERPHFIETLDEYVSGLADVVDAAGALSNARLIIRLHPGCDFIMDAIKALLHGSLRCIISIDGSFRDVLAASDMLISYSSTTIDEALINGMPVLLYDKWARYNHFGTGVYHGPGSKDVFPVCYVNSRAMLGGALEYMIKKTKETPREKIDVSRYSYGVKYSTENFYAFIKGALEKERGL